MLRFESQGVDNSGDYQCELVNVNGTAESNVATIIVLGEQYRGGYIGGSRI